jgi:hypothetical protein
LQRVLAVLLTKSVLRIYEYTLNPERTAADTQLGRCSGTGTAPRGTGYRVMEVVMFHDAVRDDNEHFDEGPGARVIDDRAVGTVEVQILLSWFFETGTPADVSVEVPYAA